MLPKLLLFGEFEGAHEGAFGTAVEFVANRPVITPDEIGRLMGVGIDEEEGALEIIEEGAVGQFVKIEEQAMIQLLGLVGVTPGMKEDESFADFDVAPLVGIDLENDHDAAKDEQEKEEKDEFVLPQKTHANFLWRSCDGCATELTANKFELSCRVDRPI
jgi:hypothetical protein